TGENYDSFKLNTLSVLGIDYPIVQEEFTRISAEDLSRQLYDTAYAHYLKKNNTIAEKAFPIIKDIHDKKGATIVDILVPFTDRKKQIGISSNLEKNVDTHCKELIRSMEKFATLAFIDQAWKEHLREM